MKTNTARGQSSTLSLTHPEANGRQKRKQKEGKRT
jgi:hypothetical protein